MPLSQIVIDAPKVEVGVPVTEPNEPIEVSEVYFGQDVMVATSKMS
jgi:hypothetical protein